MKKEKKEKNRIKIIAIGGPTASGKTAASLYLAKKFNGAVINCDSRQIYQEMDISTDKITYTLPYRDPINYKGIDHYGINITNLEKIYTLHDWLIYTHQAIKMITEKNQLPFLVGGTGLYIQAVVDNYKLKPDFDEKLRNELNHMSLEELQMILQKLDSKTYQLIDYKNPRRIIRAIEKIKSRQSDTKTKNMDEKYLSNKYDSLVLSFFPNREEIKKKITSRVDEHIKKGVLDEVSRLVKKYGQDHPILNGTISVQEYIPYILGKTTLENAKEKVCINNYHYAKRQMTWFRKYGNTIFCQDFKEMEEKIKNFLT